MQRAKLLFVAMFTLVTAGAAAMTLTAPTLQAKAAAALVCGNTYCNPGETSCQYNWNSGCNLSGTPPHYCDGWSKCGVE